MTTAERKRILLNGIYGVDIDPQAVEVTKLSLLLKVLEGESGETLMNQLKLFQERALPDLSANIRCGNSLIGPDFYDGAQLTLLGDEDQYRINCFDWEKEFPEVFKISVPSLLTGVGSGGGETRGGFDAVIGNPPYIRIQTMKEWAPLEVEFYKTAFAAAGKGNYDIYVVFVEKGLSLLNTKGRLGFILPHKFFNAQYGEPLRGLLAEGKHLAGIVHFGDAQVFSGATTYTCLLFLNKAGADACRFTKVDDLDAWQKTGQGTEGAIPAANVTVAEWNFTVGRGADLFEKLRRMPLKLGDVAHIFVGTQTSADSIFTLEGCSFEGQYIVGISKSLDRQVRIEAACVVPFLKGKDIRRYETPKTKTYLICPYEILESDFRLMTTGEFSDRFPLAMNYLESNKTGLTAREKGKFRNKSWHAYGYPKSMTLFQKSKIIMPDYNNVASFTFDTFGHFYKIGYGIILTDNQLSPLYVLGIINSPLLFKYLVSIGTSLRGGYIRFWTQYIEQLPIRTIDFADPADRERHDRMVALVEEMLALHRRLAAARTDYEQTNLKRQIDAADRRIDRLVYDLYNLTEAEIRLVEKD